MACRVSRLHLGLVLLAAACGPGAPSATSSTSSSSASASTGGTTAGDSTATSVPAPTTTAIDTTGAPGSTGASTTSGTGLVTTTSTSSSGGDLTSSTGPVEPPTKCPGGQPLFQLPELTMDEGLERCPDGQIHRHTAVECVHPLPVEPCKDPALCKEPCSEHGDGVCNTYYNDWCTCQYPCTTDADCQPDAACLCEGGLPVDGGYEHYITFTQCVLADCRTDADCGDFLCALSPGICGYGTISGLFCHTAQDECVSDEECVAKKLGNLCMFEPAEKRWTCTEQILCE